MNCSDSEFQLCEEMTDNSEEDTEISKAETELSKAESEKMTQEILITQNIEEPIPPPPTRALITESVDLFKDSIEAYIYKMLDTSAPYTDKIIQLMQNDITLSQLEISNDNILNENSKTSLLEVKESVQLRQTTEMVVESCREPLKSYSENVQPINPHRKSYGREYVYLSDSTVLKQLKIADEQARKAAKTIAAIKKQLAQYAQKDEITEEEMRVVQQKRKEITDRMSEFEDIAKRVKQLVGLSEVNSTFKHSSRKVKTNLSRTSEKPLKKPSLKRRVYEPEKGERKKKKFNKPFNKQGLESQHENEQRINNDQQRINYDQQRINYDQQRINYDQQRINYDQQRINYDQQRINYDQQQHISKSQQEALQYMQESQIQVEENSESESLKCSSLLSIQYQPQDKFNQKQLECKYQAMVKHEVEENSDSESLKGSSLLPIQYQPQDKFNQKQLECKYQAMVKCEVEENSDSESLKGSSLLPIQYQPQDKFNQKQLECKYQAMVKREVEENSDSESLKGSTLLPIQYQPQDKFNKKQLECKYQAMVKREVTFNGKQSEESSGKDSQEISVELKTEINMIQPKKDKSKDFWTDILKRRRKIKHNSALNTKTQLQQVRKQQKLILMVKKNIKQQIQAQDTSKAKELHSPKWEQEQLKIRRLMKTFQWLMEQQVHQNTELQQLLILEMQDNNLEQVKKRAGKQNLLRLRQQQQINMLLQQNFNRQLKIREELLNDKQTIEKIQMLNDQIENMLLKSKHLANIHYQQTAFQKKLLQSQLYSEILPSIDDSIDDISNVLCKNEWGLKGSRCNILFPYKKISKNIKIIVQRKQINRIVNLNMNNKKGNKHVLNEKQFYVKEQRQYKRKIVGYTKLEHANIKAISYDEQFVNNQASIIEHPKTPFNKKKTPIISSGGNEIQLTQCNGLKFLIQKNLKQLRIYQLHHKLLTIAKERLYAWLKMRLIQEHHIKFLLLQNLQKQRKLMDLFPGKMSECQKTMVRRKMNRLRIMQHQLQYQKLKLDRHKLEYVTIKQSLKQLADKNHKLMTDKLKSILMEQHEILQNIISFEH